MKSVNSTKTAAVSNTVVKKTAAVWIIAMVLVLAQNISAQYINGGGYEFGKGYEFGEEYGRGYSLLSAADGVSQTSKPLDNGAPDKAARFGRMKRAGQINVIGGSSTLVLGHVLFGVGLTKAFDDGEGGGIVMSGIGMLFIAVGYPWAISGIPLWIVGSVKEKQYSPKATMYLLPNGVKFVMDF